MYKNTHCTAIIVAAGQGTRAGGTIPKQFVEICGKPILFHTVSKFQENAYIDEIIIATRKDYVGYCKDYAEKNGYGKLSCVVAGGAERQETVSRALEVIKGGIVVIHDGVRTFVEDRHISECVYRAYETGACALGVPVKDTLKRVNGAEITQTVDRDNLWAIQTPQAFSYDVLTKAYAQADADGFVGTDDASLVERFGALVSVVEGSSRNFKITTPEDVALAKICFRFHKQQ